MVDLGGIIGGVIGAVMPALYPDGTLSREGSDPIYDASGNIIGYGGGSDIPIKVQRDEATWAMRQAEGFAEGDVMLIVLDEGLGDVRITTEHRITDASGTEWTVQSAEQDGAGSHWICRGRRA